MAQNNTLKSWVINFLFYYKYHTLLIIVISILSFFILSSLFAEEKVVHDYNSDKPPLHILIFGEFEEDKLEEIHAQINMLFPLWDPIHLEFVYAPTEIMEYNDLASFYQNQVVIQETEPDIYIFDEHYYQQFVENGPFLDTRFLQMNIPLEKQLPITGTESEQLFYYGIDVNNFSPFQLLGDQDKFLLIHKSTSRIDSVEQFLQKLLYGG
ncbi:hypothetical protein [Alkalihalobacillus sp. 1P02AB]|uniref:hypothetical protein n=1 Tax=Alkalihalobacillus sp. 1P02AB TaxID=3132260 RepID=UPI0039A5E282